MHQANRKTIHYEKIHQSTDGTSGLILRFLFPKVYSQSQSKQTHGFSQCYAIY